MIHRAAFAGLFLWQAGALLAQVAGGFVPFVHPPQRIAGSWDMFSVPIERCDLEWQRPVRIDGRWVRAFHELSAPIEAEIIFDRVADYEHFGRAAAAATGHGPMQMELRCVLPGARRLHQRLDVP